MDKPLKILVVEDQLFTAESIKETLEDAGHQVVYMAENYNEALTGMLKYQPEMIIMDIELQDPEYDGIRTAADIRNSLQVPLIFLTGKEDSETFRRARLLSPEGYLLKPFKPNDLIYQVDLVRSRIPGTSPLPGSIYVYTNRSHVQVKRSEVILLEADGAFTNIYSAHAPTHLEVTMNIGHLLKHFPETHFYRISQSYVINLHYLNKIKDNELFFDGTAKTLRISENKRTELKKQLNIVRSPRVGK